MAWNGEASMATRSAVPDPNMCPNGKIWSLICMNMLSREASDHGLVIGESYSKNTPVTAPMAMTWLYVAKK